ncbi:hypothetical protein ACOMHN_002548 [Nucella lapillus]
MESILCYGMESILCYGLESILCYSMESILCYGMESILCYGMENILCYGMESILCYGMESILCYGMESILCYGMESILCYGMESILCYGMETIPLTPTLSRSIDYRYRRMLRSALGIFYPDRISNEHDSAKTMVGHILRMQTRSKSPLGELLLNSESGHLRRGQGRTVTLLNDMALYRRQTKPIGLPAVIRCVFLVM